MTFQPFKNPIRLSILTIIGFILAFRTTAFPQILPQRKIDSTFIAKNQHILNLKNKKLVKEYEMQIKGALLYYPELHDAKITFRVKKIKSPLMARPTIWAIFRKPSKRHYYITVSSKTNEKLEPILLKNLSYNAQVGVLGHELSHIADFHSQKSGYFYKLLFWQLNSKKIDKMENETDQRCIDHGLGFQLLDWSQEVRDKLKMNQWNGTNEANKNEKVERERYYSPATIKTIMSTMEIYKGEGFLKFD